MADTLVARLEHMGGEVRCGERVTSLDHVPEHRAALLDLVPEGVLEVAGDRLSPAYRKRLQRYRHGPGVFKVDWTLDGPIPWRAPACARAATVHLGGTLEEIARSEHEVGRGRPPERPFVILVQPTLFDPTRAPDGKHVAWAYCHVPNGCDQDLTKAVEDQVERFAPGFRDLVRQRRTWTPAQLQAERPTASAAISAAGAWTSASSSRGRSRASTPTAPPTPRSSSAQRPRRPPAASTGCAAGTRRAPLCALCWASNFAATTTASTRGGPRCTD